MVLPNIDAYHLLKRIKVMKIVQSLWSKPGQVANVRRTSDANRCGWLGKKYNYLSWALSCLQFKRYYDEVELITDKAGYDLLIHKLELPYTSTRVVLDDLNHYHPDLWAIGKIYAYSIQEKPFIHADGDVYVWQKFDDDLEHAALLCQNKEEGYMYNNMYSRVFLLVAQYFEYFPEALNKSIDKHGAIRAINAGIIGGHNIKFFKEYCKKAFEFVDKNLDNLQKIPISSFNTVFEQFLFRALSEEAREAIHYFYGNGEPMYVPEYAGIPSRVKYLHICGHQKKRRYAADYLEYLVQTHYPDYYFKIINLLRRNEI